jgi:hypothetical protein
MIDALETVSQSNFPSLGATLVSWWAFGTKLLKHDLNRMV